MTLFDRIKEIAKKRGYSIAEIEREAGVSTNYMYQWKKRNPNPETLESVAKILGVSIDYLLNNNEATEQTQENDTIDLENFLKGNLKISLTYGGEHLSDEEIDRLKIAMNQIFWTRGKHEK